MTGIKEFIINHTWPFGDMDLVYDLCTIVKYENNNQTIIFIPREYIDLYLFWA